MAVVMAGSIVLRIISVEVVGYSQRVYLLGPSRHLSKDLVNPNLSNFDPFNYFPTAQIIFPLFRSAQP